MTSTNSILTALVRFAFVATVMTLGAAGCADDPPIKLRYELSKGPAQECAGDCESTMLYCKSVLSVRIIDPAHPEEPPYLTVCRSLTEKRSLCQMAQVRLVSENELPRRRLAIQVALYNADDLEIDGAGDPICPQDQPYAANGFAKPSDYRPAIAGMGYYTPGEEETVVPLGCADVTLVQTQTCQGKNLVKITATADDFDSGVYLQDPVVNAVELKVGEPEQTDDGYEIPLSSITKLDRVTSNVPPPAWGGERDRAFESSVCLILQEDVAQSTPTVTCRLVSPTDTSFDLRGLRLNRNTLQQVLNVISEPQFPKRGLVVGMVVDHLGQPLAGVTVTPSTSASVEYLGPARDRLVFGATSSSGIFLSRNANYTTSWSAPGTSTAFGGLIADKVTIVILQADPPSS